jgi:hypothetical protein
MERRMTPDERNEDLRRLWKSQSDDVAGLSLEVVHARSRMLERKVRRRNYGEYLAALVVVAFVAPRIWTAPNGVLRAGAITLLAGIAYVMYRIHTASSPRTMPTDVGVLSCVEFHRAELERQRNSLQNIWAGYLLPFWPGGALILIGQVVEQPDRWPFALGTAALAVLIAVHIAWMNKRTASALQGVIDRLDENPGETFRSAPPTPTLSQQLNVWFLTSFLGATAIGLVVRRVFPEAIASIQPLSELPAVTRNIVFLLVLVVAGMIVQALWWAMRRR